MAPGRWFGNVRNYPNPGMPERPGLIGQADGGCLFLGEIGELSTELQAHLLRVLKAHEAHFGVNFITVLPLSTQ
jgi:DNA-binding NtrC family response regulator